jgi:hypothetical protein
MRCFSEDHQMKDEALRMALEALESCDQVYGSEGSYQYFSQAVVDKAIAAIKQALATQPAVPDAIGPNEDELPAYAAGWNDCRQTMLEILKARGNT